MEQPIVHVDELVGGGSVINGLLHLLSYAGEHGVRVLRGGCCHRQGDAETGYSCDGTELAHKCHIAVQV